MAIIFADYLLKIFTLVLNRKATAARLETEKRNPLKEKSRLFSNFGASLMASINKTVSLSA